jgi:hypothetical protein
MQRYFDDVDEGTLPYLERQGKVMEKFKRLDQLLNEKTSQLASLKLNYTANSQIPPSPLSSVSKSYLPPTPPVKEAENLAANTDEVKEAPPSIDNQELKNHEAVVDSSSPASKVETKAIVDNDISSGSIESKVVENVSSQAPVDSVGSNVSLATNSTEDEKAVVADNKKNDKKKNNKGKGKKK